MDDDSKMSFFFLGLGLGAALPSFGRGQKMARWGAIAQGASLKPPTSGPVKVAVAVSKGTTWIDFVGPEAAFSTWHFDPVEKKHKPAFEVLISQTFDPADPNLDSDAQFGVTRALLGDYVRHDEPHPHDPSLAAPWYSLDHTYVMERGETVLPAPPIE